MILRRPSIFFGLLVLFVPAATAQWRRIETGSLAWLHAAHFIDQKTGWVGGSNGTLLLTKDGGFSWEKKKLPISDNIRDIIFLNGSEGWVLCDRGQFGEAKRANRSYLMHTVDGGDSWSEIEFQISTEPRTRVFFDSKGEGYAVGEGGVMTGFPSEGKPEKRFRLPTRYLIVDGVSLNASRIVLVGGGGTIVRTEDRGKSWEPANFKSLPPTAKLNAVMFLDEKHGWAVGNDGAVLSSVDGGKSWSTEASNTSIDLTDVLFSDLKNGFAVGKNGTVLRSRDGGGTWRSEATGSKHRLECLVKAGDNVLAVGFGGTILIRKLEAR